MLQCKLSRNQLWRAEMMLVVRAAAARVSRR
jgi:hypothetical protein